MFICNFMRPRSVIIEIPANPSFLNRSRMGFYALLLILMCNCSLKAQTSYTDNLHLTADYHRGYVLPEYKYSLFIAKKYVHSASLSLTKKTTGKNDWEQLYHYPEFGFTVFFSTLGNQEVNGSELALFPYFNLPVYSRKRFCIFNRTGIGIGYVTRKFDLDNNYQNIAVGSHFNMHFNNRFGLSFRVMDKIDLEAGISFDHFSNANMQEPNLGLNYVTSFLGAGYRLGESSTRQKHELQPHKKDSWFELVLSIGGKHTRAFQSTFFYTFSVSAEYKWEPFRVFRAGIGADLFYDSSTETEMEALNLTHYEKSDNFRTGIHLSEEIVYNRFSIIIQEGIYLVLTDRVNQNIMYNRGIVKYRIREHFFIGISMKSHLHILDYPEIGFGYRF